STRTQTSMAALIPRMAFVSEGSIALVSRLSLIAELAMRAWRHFRLQFLNFDIQFFIVVSLLFSIEIEPVLKSIETNKSSAHLAREAHLVTSYLDIDEMIRTATDAAADAIHPGYGFLSENAALSAACAKAGIVFIGPAPETIRRMGDKLESKRVMQEAGVPVVPAWNGDPPDFEYPVLVKAVGGGGGKGMRLVENPADLDNAVASASREAEPAF